MDMDNGMQKAILLELMFSFLVYVNVVRTFSCVLCYASVSYFLETGSLTESGARLATASDTPVFIPLSALYVGAVI